MYSEVVDANITALKWKDKRDVTILSTCPDTGMINISRRSRDITQGMESIQKPALVDDYNSHMGGVDISDQLVKYYGYPHN